MYNLAESHASKLWMKSSNRKKLVFFCSNMCRQLQTSGCQSSPPRTVTSYVISANVRKVFQSGNVSYRCTK